MCFPELLEKPNSLPGEFPHMVSQVVSVLRQLLRNSAQGAQGPEAQSGEATTTTFFGAQRTQRNLWQRVVEADCGEDLNENDVLMVMLFLFVPYIVPV